MNKFVAVCCLVAVVCAVDGERKPIYKYRYQTEDLMKTAETSVPVHGYHVVEGGYYPAETGFIGTGAGGYGGKLIGSGAGLGIGSGIGLGGSGIGLGGAGLGLGSGIGVGGIGGASGIGLGGVGTHLGGAGLGYGGHGYIGPGVGLGGAGLGLHGAGIGLGGAGIGLGGAGIGLGGAGLGVGGGYVGAPYYHHGYGGSEVDRSAYSGGKKNFNDLKYEKAAGKQGEEFDHGQEGYTKGKAAVVNNKGENGYYSDTEGGKKVIEDGKAYHGGQQFAQQGQNGLEKKENKGHKKGHIIKGFKKSHHKDESGKTEEFYDEENDEGKHVFFNGQSGSFGEKGASSFKGGHEDGKFNHGEKKKEGHYKNEHFIDNAKGDQGRYGEKKYSSGGSIYGINNGLDQESLLGHQESSRFYKHHPHHIPFYGGY